MLNLWMHILVLSREVVKDGSPEEFTIESKSRRCAGKPEVIHLANMLLLTILERGVWEFFEGTVDEHDVPVFRPPCGQNCHRSNVRVHLIASVGYDLLSSRQKQPVVAFQTYHEM